MLLLSVFSLELGVLGARLFPTWDTASVDLRMRWRYRFAPQDERTASSEIALLAIDTATQRRYGRFGAGQWVLRQPFLDQVRALARHAPPSVIAYDLIFVDTQGTWGRADRVSESEARLKRMAESLNQIAARRTDHAPLPVLYDINRFAFEQGNSLLAMALSDVAMDETCPIVLGCYLRGGVVDPQPRRIPTWSDDDVFGDDPEGDESRGRRVPYLRDIAIPDADIHFPTAAGRNAYDYSVNAVLPSLELLDYSRLGFLNCPREEDSAIRRIPLVLGFRVFNSKTKETSTAFAPSFSLLCCLLHLGIEIPIKEKQVEVFMGRSIVIHSPTRGDFEIPIDADGRMYLNFTATMRDFETLSFVQAALPAGLTPEEESASVRRLRSSAKDRIVFVGVNTTGLDIGDTPLAANIPLVYVHMTAASNILGRHTICPMGTRNTRLLLAGFCMAFTAVCLLERTARLGLAFVLGLVLYLLAAYIGVHTSRFILPVVAPVIYLSSCSFSVLSYRFFTEERARRRIRGMFSTMVSDKVLTYLEENPESFSLRGHTTEATVFFSDIAGFTAISENLSPQQLTDLINAYLTPVTDCILEQGGYVDKYVGDSVMAVWGAPYPDPDHAKRACAAALDQQAIVARLNPAMKRDYGAELGVRMGINSGPVTAGNMGSQRKFQYTVMGDTVNQASRFEPVNKDFGTRIIIGETTARMVAGDFVTRPLGRIRVVGKERVVTIHELVGRTGGVLPAQLDVIEQYAAALDAFHARHWDEGLERLEAILRAGEDGPSEHLRQRLRVCRETPPGDDWQGEYVRGQKE